MGSRKSWYMKGNEGYKRAKKEDADAQKRREQRGPMRLWLQKETAAKMVFVDNPTFFIYEHNLYHLKQEFHYETCIKDIDTCPLCEDGDNPAIAVVCTVIRIRKWTDREGKTHHVQKMLFVAKGRAREKLFKQLERRGGSLVGCLYEVSRGSTQTEASTGEDFEYLDKRLGREGFLKLVPKGEKPKDYLKAADYEKIFAPKSPAELRKLVGAEEPIGGEEDEADIDDLLKDEKGDSVETDGEFDLDSLGDIEEAKEEKADGEDVPIDIDGDNKEEEAGEAEDEIDLSDLDTEEPEEQKTSKPVKKPEKKKEKKAEPQSIEELL